MFFGKNLRMTQKKKASCADFIKKRAGKHEIILLWPYNQSIRLKLLGASPNILCPNFPIVGVIYSRIEMSK